ncbi:MAG: glutamine-hydrolyzing GMP synthase [Bacteroidales bacterium]|nr:glutamine-hydrolyzing GMP synthase [Bacteroidales bacterium]
MQEKIIILDFGSQYTQLIARRVRELNVYCEIHPFNDFPEIDEVTKGIILSGSPYSVRDKNSPFIDVLNIRKNLPVLAVCYGAQLIAQNCGGEVLPSKIREYGRANLSTINKNNILFKNIPEGTQVWMSHGDTIKKIPENFEILAGTAEVEVAAFEMKNQNIFGVQFHPEVYHTTEGIKLLKNFVVDICKASQSWTPDSFAEATISLLKEKLGNDKVVLGLSGGVDSTVTAVLLNKAIGKNLYCIFVDNGLLRKNEFRKVLDSYKKYDLNVVGVDASDIFLNELKGISNPEKKRKAIGKAFIDVFDKEAHKIKDVKWLAQGTIYPDIIESKSVKGPSATIKSHHNVGGLPDYMKLKIVEPLNTLFKDEVRKVGKILGIDENFLKRHPFPGPGLAIRILGEITKEKLDILKEADDIFIEGLKKENLYDAVWQAATIFLPVQSVGVMGDERTYENAICLRAVTSTDGMTADWVHLPYEFLAKISSEIINKVKGVNRVVYDISSKPPATIEWE